MEKVASKERVEELWENFLGHYNIFLNALEAGSQCEKSKPWFGRLKNERKRDSLLLYLDHARNVDVHRFEPITARSGGSLMIGAPGETVHISSMMTNGGKVMIHLGSPATVRFSPSELLILPVTDRGVNYGRPSRHRGHSVGRATPRNLAGLTLIWMQEKLDEFEALTD
jgi:hypothetical protein